MFAHLVETKMIVIGQNVSVQEYTLILSDTNENEFQVIFYPSNHTNYNVSMMWPRGRKLGLDVWELYVCRLQCRHECWWCRFGQPISNQHFDHLSFNLQKISSLPTYHYNTRFDMIQFSCQCGVGMCVWVIFVLLITFYNGANTNLDLGRQMIYISYFVLYHVR